MVQPRVDVQKPNKNKKEKSCYSDAELAEFRERIEQKLQTARNELKYYKDQLERKDDSEGAETKFQGTEDGSSTAERNYLNQIAVREAQNVNSLEAALVRIQNKTYGICVDTGKLIPRERLWAIPDAVRTAEAAEASEKTN